MIFREAGECAPSEKQDAAGGKKKTEKKWFIKSVRDHVLATEGLRNIMKNK